MQLLQDDDATVHEAVCLLLQDGDALLVQLRHEKVAHGGAQGLADPPLFQRIHRLLQRGLDRHRHRYIEIEKDREGRGGEIERGGGERRRERE